MKRSGGLLVVVKGHDDEEDLFNQWGSRDGPTNRVPAANKAEGHLRIKEVDIRSVFDLIAT
jgi:hypothetical protein